MSGAVDELVNFLKIHPVYSLLVTSVILALLVNVLSDLLGQKYGAFNAIAIVLIALVLSLLTMPLYSWIEGRKREKLRNTKIPSFEPIKEKYKGLIVAISRINENEGDLINLINKVKDTKGIEGVAELYEIRGVGQTFRAIAHHLGVLEFCWLLFTEQSKEAKDVVVYFIKEFASGTVKQIPVPIDDPFNIKSTYKVVSEIYGKGLGEVNLRETEVIADITGGTAPMSAAIILVCASSDRAIEYVEQDTNALIKVEHI
jgi:hypothetical protein